MIDLKCDDAMHTSMVVYMVVYTWSASTSLLAVSGHYDDIRKYKTI